MSTAACPRIRPPASVVAEVIGTVLVASLVAVGCSPAQARSPEGPGRPNGRWQVDFHETFDGTRLDADRWSTCHWWGPEGCTIAGNDEAEWYSPSQVAVGGGRLRLTARPQRSSHDGRSFTFASGMVSTGRSGDGPDDRARYAFTYGYVEVRFRTPDGDGLWPAIWMLPVTNRSRPEIDLLEQYGHDTRRVTTALHTGAEGHARRDRGEAGTGDLARGWHTAALLWDPGHLTWSIDGDVVHEVTGDRVPSEPMYLVMNLAVGGSAGERPVTAPPATFLIDDVTVWRST